MANFNWIGGASKTTHVMTVTIANTWSSSNPDTIKTTVIDEGGTPQSVTTNATSSTIQTGVRDPHLTDLQNSTLTVFQAITWTSSGTDKIVATAKISGKPLSGGSVTNLITDASTTAGDGTATWANTTANSGPNDANTDANWTDENEATTTSPLDTGVVKILPHPTDVDAGDNPISYDIRYGLDQSSIDLNELRIGRSYTGIIGDPIQEFYFQIDCQTAADSVTVIDSNSPSIWIKGNHDAINIAGLPRGEDALHLHGGTITILRMLGPRVLGKITIADSCILVTVESLGANMEVDIGTQTGTTITNLTIDGGVWRISRGIDQGTAGFKMLGGTVVHLVGSMDTADNYGGSIFFNSTGTITNLNNYSGVSNFERNTSHGITVTNAKIWSGEILDRSGLKNVTWTNNVIVYGGSVSSDTASTQSQSA